MNKKDIEKQAEKIADSLCKLKEKDAITSANYIYFLILQHFTLDDIDLDEFIKDVDKINDKTYFQSRKKWSGTVISAAER